MDNEDLEKQIFLYERLLANLEETLDVLKKEHEDLPPVYGAFQTLYHKLSYLKDRDEKELKQIQKGI